MRNGYAKYGLSFVFLGSNFAQQPITTTFMKNPRIPASSSFPKSSLALALACLLSCWGIPVATVSAQATFDFNTAGQLNDNFYPGTQGAVGPQVVSGGLDNSGWVSNTIIAGGRGFAVTDASFPVSASPITLSIYFKWQTNTLFLGEALQLGVGRSTDPDTAFSPLGGNAGSLGPASLQLLQVGIGPRTVADQVRIYGSSIVNGTNTNFNQPASPTVTLVDGNWYYLEVGFSLLPTEDGLAFSVNLNNANSSGVVGSNLLSWSSQQINSALVDGDLQAFFGTRNAAQVGISGVDNFSVSAIPEPSSLALVAGLGGVLISRGIRRKFFENNEA